MPARNRLTTLGLALAGTFAVLVAACTSPGSQPIIGPDGSAMAHVHCGSDQGVCFRIAGELCPLGYEMKPVLSGNDGNFLVHCRDSRIAASVPSCPAVAAPAPVVATTTSTKKSSEAWPPSTEPWPAAYPWPAPETSVAVQPTKAGSPASTTPDAVDIGY